MRGGRDVELRPGSLPFDAVISRVGLIYFPDRQKALTGMRRALRYGGRVAAIVDSAPEGNAFFPVPIDIIRRRQQLPSPLPGQPGPFSLGGAGVIEAAFERAGFREPRTVRVAAPLQVASAAECLRFQKELFGALHQMLSGLEPAARADVWHEIGEALREFEGPEGFTAPCELVVAAAAK